MVSLTSARAHTRALCRAGATSPAWGTGQRADATTHTHMYRSSQMTITTITNRGQHTTELPSIDCRGGPDAAAGEVRRYILEQRAPVKLTGLAEGWLPLPTPWSDLSALKKAFPDIPVTVGYAPCAAGAHGAGALASFDGINPANGDVEFAALAGVGLADAVEAIMAEHRALEDLSPLTERIYIAESYRTELAALLMQALPLPAWWRDSGGGDSHFSQPFFGPEGVDLPAHGASSKSLVWMSAGGTVAAPHRDLHHNFHVSLAGSKVFHLVHPYVPNRQSPVSEPPRTDSALTPAGLTV